MKTILYISENNTMKLILALIVTTFSLATGQFPVLSQNPLKLVGSQTNAQSLPNIGGRFDFNIPGRRQENGITNFGPFQTRNIPTLNVTQSVTRITEGVKNIPQTLEQVLIKDWGNFKVKNIFWEDEFTKNIKRVIQTFLYFTKYNSRNSLAIYETSQIFK